MAGCDDTRQLTETQRQAGYQQGRTGVQQAVRPFSGRPTLDNLVDYINRELYPAVKRTRDKVNDVYLPVVDNAPSGNPLGFYFSTETGNADPTAGRIRLNASPQDTATVMRVSQSNGRLVDVAAWLDVMAGGATSPLGVVTLTDAINPARFIRFDLSTMVDQGAYWDLTVAVIESSHDDPFVDGGAVVVSFIPGVGGVTPATVPPSSVSPMGANTVLGNPTAATAAPSEIALSDMGVLGRKGLAGTGNIESINVPDTGELTGESVFLRSPSVRTSLKFSNLTLTDLPLISDNRFVGNISGATARPVYTPLSSLSSATVLYENVGKTFIREALTGDVTAPQNSNVTTIAANAVTNAKLATMANNTFKANVSGATAVPSDVGLSTLANNSLSFDATNHRFDYIGSTSAINLAASGAQGVVDISTLLCGGAITLQPTADFSIDGFTAMPTGFWFDLIYRDNTSHLGTIGDNTGATTTSIRCPGGVATTITKQEAIRFKYYNTRWRVVGISGRPLSLQFPGAPIYDVMASPFNAAGDGVTDDTAAINAAIAAANADPGTIYLGPTHLITGTLTAISANSVHVQGRGIFSSGSEVKLTAGSAQDAFLFDDARYCSIRDVWIRCTNAYQTGSAIKFNDCYKCRAERLLISDFGWGIEILSSSLIHCEDVILSDLKGTEGIYAHGTVTDECHAIRLVFIAGGTQYPNTVVGAHTEWLPATAYVVGQVVLNGDGIYQATTAGTSAASGGPSGTGTGIVDGTVVWQLAMGATTWFHMGEYTATFDMTDCGALQGAYGLVVDGDDTSFLRSKNFQADHCYSGGILLSTGTQHRLDQTFVTSVFDGNGIEIGSGVTGNWEFVGGNVFGISGAGVSIQAGNGLLLGMQIVQCSTETTNTRDGIEVAAGVEHFTITGCSSGYGIGGTTPRMRYGLSIGAGCDNYVVTDNRFIDNQTGSILNTPGRATTRIVRDNIPDDTTAGNSLEFDASLDQYAYIGSLSTINLTPTGAQGVVDISTLLCGGSVTLQPGGTFDISGFTAKPQGFWFDLIYRDTTTHVGTLNENSGATTTSIRNPGNAAITFTTQEAIRLRYQLSRWRVTGRSTRSFSLTDGDKGDITVSASGATWTVDNDVVSDAKLRNSGALSVIGRSANSSGDPADISATAASGGVLRESGSTVGFGTIALAAFPSIATDTVLANVTGSTAQPTAVTLTSLANNSLSWDSTNNRFDYIGSTSAINLTPTGAQGVIDISTLLCGGSVTLQPSGTFDIDGFTAMPTGFWFDLIYRDTTTHVGTINENAGATSTSIRNPGNAAGSITTQEVIRFKYQNTRWRVAGRSSRGFVLTDGDKGDITVATSGTSWTIDNDVVTDAKLRNSAALSVIGRSANSTGDPADIAAANDGEVLRRSGTTLGFGTVATAGITDAAVTLAKMANLAQSTIIGRAESAGTGVPTALTSTQVAAIIDGEPFTWLSSHTFNGTNHTVTVSSDITLTAGGTLTLAATTQVQATSPTRLASSVALDGVTTSALTGVNNLAIGSVTAVRFTGPANPLTGMVAVVGGQTVMLINAHASSDLVIQLESPSSTAANRFAGLVTDRHIKPGELAMAWYDSTSSRWRLLCRDDVDL